MIGQNSRLSRRTPLALSPVRGPELAFDVVGNVANLGLQVGFGNALPLCSLDQALCKFGHILRRAGSPILLDGVNAILDPKIDKLANVAHRTPLSQTDGES
ncbi:hypothetical protein ABIA00_006125 [Bradyrhizobium ottawaense]